MNHVWQDPQPKLSAEWWCTRCGVTNRILLAPGTRQANDECMHCGLKHVIQPEARPVRWHAKVA